MKIRLTAKDSESALNSVLTIKAADPRVSNVLKFNIIRGTKTEEVTKEVYWTDSSWETNKGTSQSLGEIVVDQQVRTNDNYRILYFVIKGLGYELNNKDNSGDFIIDSKEGITTTIDIGPSTANETKVKVTLDLKNAKVGESGREETYNISMSSLGLETLKFDMTLLSYFRDLWVTASADITAEDAESGYVKFTGHLVIDVNSDSEVIKQFTGNDASILISSGQTQELTMNIGLSEFKYGDTTYSMHVLPTNNKGGELWNSSPQIEFKDFNFSNNTFEKNCAVTKSDYDYNWDANLTVAVKCSYNV